MGGGEEAVVVVVVVAEAAVVREGPLNSEGAALEKVFTSHRALCVRGAAR